VGRGWPTRTGGRLPGSGCDVLHALARSRVRHHRRPSIP
jgi:hypothetical protein